MPATVVHRLKIIEVKRGKVQTPIRAAGAVEFNRNSGDSISPSSHQWWIELQADTRNGRAPVHTQSAPTAPEPAHMKFTVGHRFGIVDTNVTDDFTVILSQGNADEALVAAAALTRRCSVNLLGI